MRRRDIDARPVPAAQRSGTIPRAALRRQRPPAAGRDWLPALLLAGLAVIVVVAVSGAFRPAENGAGVVATSTAGTPSPATPTLPALTPSPTTAPTATPSPTAPPTPTPTRRPTPTPTRPPTPRPTATARPSPSVTAAPSPRAGALVIVEPLDGAAVTDRSIVVRGLAPPGSTITRDIPFWFDDHTRADSSGRWSFAVDLLPGENKLTFRIGDDVATAQTVNVRYDAD